MSCTCFASANNSSSPTGGVFKVSVSRRSHLQWLVSVFKLPSSTWCLFSCFGRFACHLNAENRFTEILQQTRTLRCRMWKQADWWGWQTDVDRLCGNWGLRRGVEQRINWEKSGGFPQATWRSPLLRFMSTESCLIWKTLPRWYE